MKKMILIADDDGKHRKLISDVLQAEGYDTRMAEDGACAIGLARSTHPDLIVLDIQMPVISGLDAVKVLKADAGMRSVPVLAVTALAMREDRRQMLDAGFDGYLSKPISVKALRAEVHRLLRGTPD